MKTLFFAMCFLSSINSFAASIDRDIIDAIWLGNFNKVKDCVQAGIDPNQLVGQDAPLITATEYKRFEILRFLLENGANPNVRDGQGCTPVYVAIIRTQDEQAREYLLEHGANPNEILRQASLLEHILEIDVKRLRDGLSTMDPIHCIFCNNLTTVGQCKWKKRNGETLISISCRICKKYIPLDSKEIDPFQVSSLKSLLDHGAIFTSDQIPKLMRLLNEHPEIYASRPLLKDCVYALGPLFEIFSSDFSLPKELVTYIFGLYYALHKYSFKNGSNFVYIE